MEQVAPETELLVAENGWRVEHWLHESGSAVHFKIAEADIGEIDCDFLFEGWITFDGCFHWRSTSNRYTHSCEPEDLDDLKLAFQAIKGVAAKRIKNWFG